LQGMACAAELNAAGEWRKPLACLGAALSSSAGRCRDHRKALAG
jgi:hypothetical protein